LGLDATAFKKGPGWRPAVAAFELENARAFDTIGYALWKLMSVRTELAGLFCFRRRPVEIASFVGRLADEVVRPMPRPAGELIVVVGTRSSAATFPDGYFRVFEWRRESRRFVAAGLTRGEK
jgi:hypothetical protein